MRKYYLFITLILLISHPSWALTRVLKFENIQPNVIKNIRSKNQHLFSAELTYSVVDQIIKLIASTPGYEDAKAISEINSGVEEITITATPIKKLSELKISGNHFWDTSKIQQVLGFTSGARFDRQSFVSGANQLKDLYGKMGYLNAAIDIDFKLKDANQVDVVLQIQEGASCRIQKILFETKNMDLVSELNKISSKYLKRRFSMEEVQNLQQSITQYLADNRYINTIIDSPNYSFDNAASTATLTFSVQNPFRHTIFLEGNTSLSHSDLFSELNLNDTTRLGLNTTSDIVEKIKKSYRSRGYAKVEVSTKEKILTESYVKQIIFQIKEGPRVKIADIKYEGTFSLSQKDYNQILKENGSTILQAGFYHVEDVEPATTSLVTELQNRGFLKAKVTSTRTEFSQNDQAATVYIQLNEGPQTIVQQISFNGTSQFSKMKLLELIGLREKEPLRLNQLEESINLIKQFYLSKGYLDISISNAKEDLIEYNEDNTKADVHYKIFEGPQVIAQSITIQGNLQTHDNVILQEIDIKPGDILEIEKIRESESRLQKMGIFSTVEIKTLEAPGSEAPRTVMVKVVERDPGIFNFGAGVSNELGISLRGYTGIAYRNLFGTARALQGRVALSNNITQYKFMQYDITAGYYEPFVFNSRTRGRINFNRNRQIYDIQQAENRIIAFDTDQVDFLLEKDLTKYIKLTWKLWGLAGTRKFLADGSLNTNFQEERLQIATLGPTLDFDYRDNAFTPTRGTYTRISSEYSDPNFGSTDTVNYTLNTANFNIYTPVKKSRVVFANSLRGGYLRNLSVNNNSGVPEEKSFFLGGRSSIRGFDTLQVPPRNQLLNGADTVKIRTESHFYLVKSEFRFPIYGDFGGVLFYDGGAVKVAGINLADEYRDSVGIGFRYNTPVGPVSFEYGHKLDKKDGEAPGIFHFSIGMF